MQEFFEWMCSKALPGIELQALSEIITVTFYGFLIFLTALGYWGRLRPKSGSRILLTGGGTAGHVNPALAIAEIIKAREPEVRFLYVGTKGKAEASIVPRTGYPIRFVSASAFPGISISMDLFKFSIKLLFGMLQSFFILTSFRPSRIIATGGYVSAPVIFTHAAMKFLGMSRACVYIHEQNTVPGKFNALCGRLAKTVFLTFPSTLEHFQSNGVVAGYPVRNAVQSADPVTAKKSLSFVVPENAKVIFVFGGSLGARTINRALVDSLGYLMNSGQPLFIVHGTGAQTGSYYHAAKDTTDRLTSTYAPEQIELINKMYYRQDYFHAIEKIYAISDLVVCRGGSGSLNEVSMLGKPALIIPKNNLPGEHQIMNARAMKQIGAAKIVYEETVEENGQLVENVDGKFLADTILELITDTEQLAEMADRSFNFMPHNALEIIGDVIFEEKIELDQPGTAHLDRILTNTGLLRKLNLAYHGGDSTDYDLPALLGSRDDLLLYRHKAASLLVSKKWENRNIGVKLIGLLKYSEKIPFLLQMIEDRTPVSRLQRIFGGDYQQVGFIRRNALSALQILDHWDETIEKCVMASLDDPYYEVSSNAALTCRHFSDRLYHPLQWQERLKEKLGSKHPEIVINSAKAIGNLGMDLSALESLLGLCEHHNWQCRNAGLIGIQSILKRKVIQVDNRFKEKLSDFILISTDFRPHFEIKQNYLKLQKEINSCEFPEW